MSKPADTKTVFEQIVEQIDAGTSESAPSATDGSELEAPPLLDVKEEASDDETTEDDNFDEEPGEGADSALAEVDDLPAAPSRLRRNVRRIALAAAGVIFVAALTLLAFFGWQLKQRADIATAEHAALDAARKYAVTLSSVDSNDVDKSYREVLEGATGDFKSEYSHASGQLRQLLIDNKAVSHGVVADGAIESASKNKVEVLLFLDQSITNAVNPEPRIDRLRIMMTMERVDNRWLLSKLDIE